MHPPICVCFPACPTLPAASWDFFCASEQKWQYFLKKNPEGRIWATNSSAYDSLEGPQRDGDTSHLSELRFKTSLWSDFFEDVLNGWHHCKAKSLVLHSCSKPSGADTLGNLKRYYTLCKLLSLLHAYPSERQIYCECRGAFNHQDTFLLCLLFTSTIYLLKMQLWLFPPGLFFLHLGFSVSPILQPLMEIFTLVAQHGPDVLYTQALKKHPHI